MLVPSNNSKSLFVKSAFTKTAQGAVPAPAAPAAAPVPEPTPKPTPVPIGGKATLPAILRKKINNQLYGISTHNAQTYYEAIPMDKVSNALKQSGVIILDEDSTPLEFVMLTGRDGRASFDLAMNNQKIVNSKLVISWHKMDVSNKYEFNVYVS